VDAEYREGNPYLKIRTYGILGQIFFLGE
jgi:hypothetical protein